MNCAIQLVTVNFARNEELYSTKRIILKKQGQIVRSLKKLVKHKRRKNRAPEEILL